MVLVSEKTKSVIVIIDVYTLPPCSVARGFFQLRFILSSVFGDAI